MTLAVFFAQQFFKEGPSHHRLQTWPTKEFIQSRLESYKYNRGHYIIHLGGIKQYKSKVIFGHFQFYCIIWVGNIMAPVQHR